METNGDFYLQVLQVVTNLAVVLMLIKVAFDYGTVKNQVKNNEKNVTELWVQLNAFKDKEFGKLRDFVYRHLKPS